MTEKKTEWQIKQDKILSDRKKGMKSMTEEQKEAVKNTHNVLVDVLQCIKDMDDIYLSDVREMNTVMWKLRHEFNLGDYHG